MRAYLVVLFLWVAFDSSAAEGPEFEVASVKLSVQPVQAGPATRGGPGTSDPERISYSRFPVLRLLMTAFTLEADEVVGPDWVFAPQAPYDIEAKLPPGSTVEQANQMLQNLLQHRFSLAFHFEKKSFTGYELVIVKGGPKLRPAAQSDVATASKKDSRLTVPQSQKDRDGFPVVAPGDAALSGAIVDQHLRMTARKQPMAALLKALKPILGNYHLTDKTGLNGTYDFELDCAWHPEVGGQVDPAPDVFVALEKQLGLSLEKTKVTSDVLVIDHLEKLPTPN